MLGHDITDQVQTGLEASCFPLDSKRSGAFADCRNSAIRDRPENSLPSIQNVCHEDYGTPSTSVGCPLNLTPTRREEKAIVLTSEALNNASGGGL